MFYIRTADRLERTSAWLERIEGGLDHVRDVVVHDSLGIAEELEALMANHVSDYQDEWAATLADPERMRRFVSFVNAPGVEDPSIRFTPSAARSSPTSRCSRPRPICWPPSTPTTRSCWRSDDHRRH